MLRAVVLLVKAALAEVAPVKVVLAKAVLVDLNQVLLAVDLREVLLAVKVVAVILVVKVAVQVPVDLSQLPLVVILKKILIHHHPVAPVPVDLNLVGSQILKIKKL